MLTGMAQRIDLAKVLLKHHSPTILTGVGVVGTVATAYLTGRASFKAAKIIEQESYEMQAHQDPEDSGQFVGRRVEKDLTKIDKLKLTWRFYIPPVGAGLITVTGIVTANKISSKRIAALGIAAGISERALQEYKEKVFEKLGERQDQKMRDEIAQERVANAPISTKEVILAGTGEVLCYDMLSGRYFQSTVEEIKRAENKVNFEIVQFMRASLSQFYDEIGLPPTPYTDSVGWNSNNPIEIALSTVMSPDGRPCIAVDFTHHPTHDYDRLDY